MGDWVFSGIRNYRSGSPISVGQSGVVDILGSGQVRPDVTGLPQTLGGAPKEVDFFSGTPYLDPAGFAESPRTGNGIPLRLGTAPRYLPNVRGPHQSSEDFRLGKRFRISERAGFQFGAVLINAFNRTEREFIKASWYDPFTTNVSSDTFGRLFARGGGRRVQLEGRLEW